MATKDDAGPLLCAECKALPAVEDLMQFPGLCARCGLPMLLDGVAPRAPLPEAEDDIERARRGPVAIVAPGMTPEQAAVIREAVAYVDSIGKGARPSVADLSQAVATMRGGWDVKGAQSETATGSRGVVTMSLSKRVSDLFLACLFSDGEPTDGAVMAEGLTIKVGFHPGRLAESKPQIEAVAREIVSDDFLATGGGGASFLILCMARNGEQWGEHVNCQELVTLCIAAGIASYCLPRPMWGLFPGGMPYVTFNFETIEPSPVLARYAREIEHARSRGHVDTATRIEHERDEYQEAGQ